MATTCDTSSNPRTYTRYIKEIKPTNKQKEFIIRAKCSQRQDQYLTVEDGNLKMNILRKENPEKGVFTFKKWTVISQSPGRREKVRKAYTIQWQNLHLKGSAETGLRLEHTDNKIPDEDALFRKRKNVTKRTAIESLLYMYYYIKYNTSTNKVVFSQKRPKGCQYLGLTLKRAPDDCRFDIIPESEFQE